MKVADAIGITGFLHVQEKLGEMLSQMEVARAVFYGSEAMAQRSRTACGCRGARGSAPSISRRGKVYSRFVEIVQTLAAGGFFYAPTEADLANPEVRPYIDKYVRGRAGVSAEERIALFKLAWDVTGESFAQRMAQYVRFYSGDPIRLTAGFYAQYDKAPLLEIVERALGRRDGEAIPDLARQSGLADPVPAGRAGHGGDLRRHVAAASARRGERRAAGLAGCCKSPPPDSVVFDLDGTLWDTCATCAVAWNQVLGRHGIAFRPITELDVRRVTGRPHEECIRVVFTDVAEDDLLTLIAETQVEDNRLVGELGGSLYPDVAVGLRRLQARYPLFIVSNCQRATSSASSTGRVSGAASGTSSAGAIPACPSRRTSPP